MSNEVALNFRTGETLYFVRFNTDGTVFLTDGSSSETWGTSGRDADDWR